MILTKIDGKAEIYPAVQGEGRTIGMPCIFVRLFGCSLRCAFCDSKHTFENCNSINLTTEEVVKEIRSLQIERVVFTGGEPGLQYKEIEKVIDKLGSGYLFELETNGTIVYPESFISKISQINCSPKLKSSNQLNNLDSKRFNKEAIKSLPLERTIFKFVISNEKEDMIELMDWRTINKIPRSNIYLMPEGINSQKIIEGTRNLIEKYSSKGYNISTRLHIILYNNLKKV